ncbi:MAG: methyl-accepting chemotaxis protein [Lachnoclostridium sp.]|jgi:methyl-accepting chemotaxis protein|nr:methyl-accepting chemotaxis protein [Lachnoclostridium sp.]
MEGRQSKATELSRVNFGAILCHGIENVIISAAYLLEFAKGARTLQYVSLIIAMAIIPVIAEVLLYVKNKESKAIKYMVGSLFCVLYAYVLLTTNNPLGFVYIFPMFITITLFSDIIYDIVVTAVIVILNIISIIILHPDGFTGIEMASAEIQILVLVIVGIYLVTTSHIIKRNNKEKLDLISAEKNTVSDLLDTVMISSGKITEDIKTMSGEMLTLGDSVTQTKDAMKEVSGGTTDTAESLQDQLSSSEDIHTHVKTVHNMSKQLQISMEETNREVQNGKNNIDSLMDQADESSKASVQLVPQLEELNEQMEKMHSIIEIITGIARQTSLLALNASIEAARAGEAGRGFNVVAGEIGNLSGQTQTATITITDLINQVSSKLDSVVGAVQILMDSNKRQNELAASATDNLEKISQSQNDLGTQTKDLDSIIEKLKSANEGIVESIQSVSSIMEEVSAHATETSAACEHNAGIVAEMEKLVQELRDSAELLMSKQQA